MPSHQSIALPLEAKHIDNDSSPDKRGDARPPTLKITRNKSTESIKSGNVEWWVLRPPPEDDDDGRARSPGDPPGDWLSFTWCGGPPELKSLVGKPTTVFEKGLFGPLRRKCAEKRRRYQWNGFDLDLSYITSRVIAMGFPGTGRQGLFRNPHSEVARFLKWAHDGHFRIYNLCCEEKYRGNGFPESTVHFPCVDHCPPPLPFLLDFCENAKAWLAEDETNVIVVHCKAGKGRTGSMICALLVFADAVPSAYHALRWYEWARAGKRSGVTIPDQIRWIAMLERWLRKQLEGLASDPMARGPAPDHRLVHVRLGPLVWNSGGYPVSIQVGLLSRSSLESGKPGFWYPRTVAEDGGEKGIVELRLPEDTGPVWKESDGLLVVHVRRTARGLRSCAKEKESVIKLKTWWCHPYLRRREGESSLLYMEVAKAWVQGVEKTHHKDVSDKFKLVATFKDLGLLSL